MVKTSKTEKDEFLINKIRSGDRKAEEQLYEKYRKSITKYIVTKYPFNYDTDDDVSEILIKVFQTINNYDEKKSKFNTWIINIAQNHMIDKSRSSSYNVITNSDGYSSDDSGIISTTTSCFFSATPTSSLPDFNLEMNDSLDFMENKIGIQDFHLLNMKYIEGYDYDEMAKEMRTSSSTISNRVNYIKSRLKKKKGGS